MIEALKKIDTELFLFLNDKHNAVLDVIMFWVSQNFFWIPLYALFLFLILKKYRRNAATIIVSVFVLFGLSDRFSVFLKNTFLRYRPCHNADIEHFVHLVNGYCGGQYGFVSSHATNTFALATFLSFVFANSPKPIFGQHKYFTILIFGWASLISYSRIYLGQHYPADVVVGALLGICLGYIVVKVNFYVEKRISHKGTNSSYE